MNTEAILRTRDIAYTTEKFNSNNAWGFGGATGTRYHFNLRGKECNITDAKAYYRHAPSERFIALWVDGKRVVDMDSGKRAVQKVSESIDAMINEG